jgi:PKHD-type hydroxylase
MDSSRLLQKNSNLDNYYFFPKVLSDEEIEAIMEIARDAPEVAGKIGYGVNDVTYRNSVIKWLHHNEKTKKIYERLNDLAVCANQRTWKFNITNVFESLQFTEYSADVQGHYDWHMDVGNNNSTRKLSMSIQLTDPAEYEGGNLEFMKGRNPNIAPREKGTVIFFPSYLLHRVTPVTRGKRNSLVLWYHGPTFS